MSGFLQYAWSKRGKVWSRRGRIAEAVGRQAIRLQYRFAGSLIGPRDEQRAALRSGRSGVSAEALGPLKAANPFIEYQSARLKLKPAPIATMLRETYAQCNEDVIVEALLRARFSATGRPLSSIRYLEIGGNHPVQTSSTYLFYRAWGGAGYIVEANAPLAKRLKTTRPRDTVVETAVSDKNDEFLSFYIHELDELSTLSEQDVRESDLTGLPGTLARVETVPNMHINSFFKTYIREPLDFMSIDIEGLDLLVLQALDPSHRPTILQVECVDAALLTRFQQTLGPRNYELVGLTDVNAIFAQIGR